MHAASGVSVILPGICGEGGEGNILIQGLTRSVILPFMTSGGEGRDSCCRCWFPPASGHMPKSWGDVMRGRRVRGLIWEVVCYGVLPAGLDL